MTPQLQSPKDATSSGGSRRGEIMNYVIATYFHQILVDVAVLSSKLGFVLHCYNFISKIESHSHIGFDNKKWRNSNISFVDLAIAGSLHITHKEL